MNPQLICWEIRGSTWKFSTVSVSSELTEVHFKAPWNQNIMKKNSDSRMMENMFKITQTLLRNVRMLSKVSQKVL